MRRWSWFFCLAVASLSAGGCADQFTSDDAMSHGLVIILPGIEGESGNNHGIRNGLWNAGIHCGMPIYKWGTPIPGPAGMAINQTDVRANRAAGVKIAGYIQDYRARYPDKPVFLVGHSAGGGVAVFTAEALTDMGAPPISGMVLISSSISADYDLTRALRSSKLGLVNFYNPSDVALLEFGTGLMGNVDGGKGPSAGRTGFDGITPKVYEVMVTRDMITGLAGPHVAATRAPFVSAHVAEWIISSVWPPSQGVMEIPK